MSGAFVILSYVTDIFTKTGSSLSANNSSILISVTQIIANLWFLNIVERFNRRVIITCAHFHSCKTFRSIIFSWFKYSQTLYIGSSLLTAASFFLFGAYCLLWLKQPAFEWMPPFCFASIVFLSSMGLIPIPYIILTEIFPKKVREF